MPNRTLNRRAIAAVLATTTLAACSSLTPAWLPNWWMPGPPKPATLTRPVGSLCLAEVAAFATERTGYRVSLTDSAFVSSSDLVVPLIGLPPVPGRDGQRSKLDSEQFQLGLDGKTCRVGHAASRESVALRQCECAAR